MSKSKLSSISGFLVRDKNDTYRWSVMVFPFAGETIQADLRPDTVRQLQARYEAMPAENQVFETLEIITLKPATTPEKEEK